MAIDFTKRKMATLFFSQLNSMSSARQTKLMQSGITDLVIIPYDVSTGVNIWNIANITTSREQNLINELKSVINTYRSKKTSVKFWIGLPGIDSNCFGQISTNRTTAGNTTYQLFKRIIDALLTSHGSYISGVYYNQETIYGSYNNGSDSFPYNSLTSDIQVWLMNEIAYYVRSVKGKATLWIPVYAVNNPTYLPYYVQIKRNAHIIDKSTCFDCACLQPSYMKYPGENNFAGICKSIDMQYVCDREGNRETTNPRIGTCAIGGEFEYRGNNENFEIYTRNFQKYIGSKPMVFYWGGTVDTALAKLDATF